MIIFLFVGVFSSFVAVAMLIAMLKCCVESLSNGTSDHQKLGIMNTYQSRHSNSNTYRRNTYDADDLAEVWTTNDDNPADTQWSGCESDVGRTEDDLKFESGGDSTVGVGTDSKPEESTHAKIDSVDSTFEGGNNSSAGGGYDSKLAASEHSSSIFAGASHSAFGHAGSEHNSPFGGGHDSRFGEGYDTGTGGGHDSRFGEGFDTGTGGGSDSAFTGGCDSGFGGGDSGGCGGGGGCD